MSEHAIALMLALAKNIVIRNASLPREKWLRASGIEIRGKTAGVIGYREIGRSISRLATGLSMEVSVIRRNPRQSLPRTTHVRLLGVPADLPKLLRESDLFLAAPLTSKIRNMISEKQLRLIKPSSYMVNISRSEIADEQTLYSALSKSTIAGVGIDVWSVEGAAGGAKDSLPSKYPFQKLRNVIMTPHVAGSTPEYLDRMVKLVSRNIIKVATGKAPSNLVDLQLEH